MPPGNSPLLYFASCICFSVIFVCVRYTRNVIINVTSIGRQISELMFLWWPAILYSVLYSVCLLMANKWMMMMINQINLLLVLNTSMKSRAVYRLPYLSESSNQRQGPNFTFQLFGPSVNGYLQLVGRGISRRLYAYTNIILYKPAAGLSAR